MRKFLINFSNSTWFGILLHLCLPGMGHIFWREYAFGLFIFLIMILATVVLFISFFAPLLLAPIQIPTIVVIILLALPLIFYFFSYIDLARSIKQNKNRKPRSLLIISIFISIVVLFQFLVPNAPLNFMIRNFPELFIAENNRLSPQYTDGTMLMANSLSYSFDLFFFEQPIYYDLPMYGDIIRFKDSLTVKHSGIVLGHSTDIVEIVQGKLIVNDQVVNHDSPLLAALSGDWQSEFVYDNHVLIATISLGRVDRVYQVPYSSIIGKVMKIL